MINVKRYEQNPILMPDASHGWESFAVLNGSIIKKDDIYHLLYRAISQPQEWQGTHMHVSSIGHAISTNGYDFEKRTQFILPEYEWERYGCEDPRVVKIDNTFVIFYTAISTNPPSPSGIKVGVALTPDFMNVEEKHLVTPFNAKAMVLFPQKINDKYTAILTVDTDNPPAKIAIAQFDTISDLWEKSFWDEWYANVSEYTLPLLRRSEDQVEVGLAPFLTDKGWILVYSYIQNYTTPHKVFGIEALLLDKSNPFLILGKTNGPFMIPETYPEKYGTIPNIIFPSGGIVENEKLRLYYGASDTAICTAEIPVLQLINDLQTHSEQIPLESVHSALHLVRFEGNPILKPISDHPWEKQAVLNAAVYTHDNNAYILYRAMDDTYNSRIGLAITHDGYHVAERLSEPIYIPRAEFEKNPTGAGGCEDARVTPFEDRLIMHYTGYDGKVPRVVHTSISQSDFLKGNWNWKKPQVISSPTVMDKNSCVFPEKINGKFAILHRLDVRIWMDFVNDFSEFTDGRWLAGTVLASPRPNMWDSIKVGIAGPPLKTELGWLLIYHGISQKDQKYRLGIMILDEKDPTKILLRLNNFILEPKLPYENSGIRPGAVFSCGSAVLNDTLFVYYGAGDSTVGVAEISYSYLLSKLKEMIK